MTFSKTAALAFAGVMLSASCAFAQVGGGNEMPNDAKANGTANGGTEGRNSGTTSGPSSRGAGTGENKPTATGGQSGGATDQQ